MASLCQEEREKEILAPGHSEVKDVAHLLTLLSSSKYLHPTLASETSHRTAPFVSELLSYTYLQDSLGEINAPHTPKTALFLSPVHP